MKQTREAVIQGLLQDALSTTAKKFNEHVQGAIAAKRGYIESYIHTKSHFLAY